VRLMDTSDSESEWTLRYSPSPKQPTLRDLDRLAAGEEGTSTASGEHHEDREESDSEIPALAEPLPDDPEDQEDDRTWMESRMNSSSAPQWRTWRGRERTLPGVRSFSYQVRDRWACVHTFNARQSREENLRQNSELNPIDVDSSPPPSQPSSQNRRELLSEAADFFQGMARIARTRLEELLLNDREGAGTDLVDQEEIEHDTHSNPLGRNSRNNSNC